MSAPCAPTLPQLTCQTLSADPAAQGTANGPTAATAKHGQHQRRRCCISRRAPSEVSESGNRMAGGSLQHSEPNKACALVRVSNHSAHYNPPPAVSFCFAPQDDCGRVCGCPAGRRGADAGRQHTILSTHAGSHAEPQAAGPRHATRVRDVTCISVVEWHTPFEAAAMAVAAGPGTWPGPSCGAPVQQCVTVDLKMQ